ncbi:thioredoxin family protein [Paenibacillus paeoniae]|uniref:Thioredoxin n=1 Tax=Paenibacillus paeoniae TaxID=2292705 RepID=A0A371PND5_9BACL|nr:thioredoxin family protein [Paenibacillus paeoniae]REK77455.1 thioredoxin [Paenibacillus paeoniae]
MKKKTKKFSMIYVYIGIIIILFGSIFVLGNMEKDNTLYGMPASELNPATRSLLDNPNYQNIILPDEMDNKIEGKEDFFVYVFSSTCRYCLNTTPQIMPLVNDMGIDLPMFNLLEFNQYGSKLRVESTPSLLYYKDGVEVDRLEGGLREEGTTQGHTLDDFKAFFTKHAGADAQ